MAVLGQKSQSVFAEYVLTTSQTWTAPKSGTIKVTCTGAGGNGAYGQGNINAYGSGSKSSAGGGAGGFAQKTVVVTAGDTYTVVIGAGGDNHTNTNQESGEAGGESTFDNATATEAIALDSNGGGGGVFNTGDNNGAAGGGGGTASGGDVNYTGGAGGTTSRANASAKSMVTGGGAVNVLGLATPPRGGNLIARGTNVSPYQSGGGGVGGNGGDFATNTANLNTQAVITQGGSSIAAAPVLDENGAFNAETSIRLLGTVPYAPVPTNRDQLDLSGSVADQYLFSAGSGSGESILSSLEATDQADRAGCGTWAGYGSTLSASNGARIQMLNPGAFAGAGGMQWVSENSGNTSAGNWRTPNGGLGGGGGGGATIAATVNNYVFTKGGNGIVIIQYIG